MKKFFWLFSKSTRCQIKRHTSVIHMYADDKMRQNYNNFKQKNHNITIMSLNIQYWLTLCWGQANQVRGKFQFLSKIYLSDVFVKINSLKCWVSLIDRQFWTRRKLPNWTKGTFFKLKTVCCFKLCVVLSNSQIKKLESACHSIYLL